MSHQTSSLPRFVLTEQCISKAFNSIVFLTAFPGEISFLSPPQAVHLPGEFPAVALSSLCHLSQVWLSQTEELRDCVGESGKNSISRRFTLLWYWKHPSISYTDPSFCVLWMSVFCSFPWLLRRDKPWESQQGSCWDTDWEPAPKHSWSCRQCPHWWAFLPTHSALPHPTCPRDMAESSCESLVSVLSN